MPFILKKAVGRGLQNWLICSLNDDVSPRFRANQLTERQPTQYTAQILLILMLFTTKYRPEQEEMADGVLSHLC